MVGEPADVALREMLDERVHLLIRINLVENSVAKNPDLERVLVRHLYTLDRQIQNRRNAVCFPWQVRHLPKIKPQK